MNLTCICGGTTSICLAVDQKDAVEQCACGRILHWTAPEPATLTINVSDTARSKDATN